MLLHVSFAILLHIFNSIKSQSSLTFSPSGPLIYRDLDQYVGPCWKQDGETGCIQLGRTHNCSCEVVHTKSSNCYNDTSGGTNNATTNQDSFNTIYYKNSIATSLLQSGLNNFTCQCRGGSNSSSSRSTKSTHSMLLIDDAKFYLDCSAWPLVLYRSHGFDTEGYPGDDHAGYRFCVWRLLLCTDWLVELQRRDPTSLEAVTSHLIKPVACACNTDSLLLNCSSYGLIKLMRAGGELRGGKVNVSCMYGLVEKIVYIIDKQAKLVKPVQGIDEEDRMISNPTSQKQHIVVQGLPKYLYPVDEVLSADLICIAFGFRVRKKVFLNGGWRRLQGKAPYRQSKRVEEYDSGFYTLFLGDADDHHHRHHDKEEEPTSDDPDDDEELGGQGDAKQGSNRQYGAHTFQCSFFNNSVCYSKLLVFARYLPVKDIGFVPMDRLQNYNSFLSCLSDGEPKSMFKNEIKQLLARDIVHINRGDGVKWDSADYRQQSRNLLQCSARVESLGEPVPPVERSLFFHLHKQEQVVFEPNRFVFWPNGTLTCSRRSIGYFKPHIVIINHPPNFLPRLHYHELFLTGFPVGEYYIKCFFFGPLAEKRVIAGEIFIASPPTELTLQQTGLGIDSKLTCSSDGYPSVDLAITWIVSDGPRCCHPEPGTNNLKQSFYAENGLYTVTCQAIVTHNLVVRNLSVSGLFQVEGLEFDAFEHLVGYIRGADSVRFTLYLSWLLASIIFIIGLLAFCDSAATASIRLVEPTPETLQTELVIPYSEIDPSYRDIIVDIMKTFNQVSLNLNECTSVYRDQGKRFTIRGFTRFMTSFLIKTRAIMRSVQTSTDDDRFELESKNSTEPMILSVSMDKQDLDDEELEYVMRKRPLKLNDSINKKKKRSYGRKNSSIRGGTRRTVSSAFINDVRELLQTEPFRKPPSRYDQPYLR